MHGAFEPRFAPKSGVAASDCETRDECKQLTTRDLVRILASSVIGVLAMPAIGGGTSARIDVRAQVLTAVTVKAPKSASVAAGEAARTGRIDNELKIRAIGPGGYKLRFEIVDPAVAFVDIHGVGRSIHLASGAADAYVASSVGERSIEYEVQYRDGVSPAGRPRPIRVTYIP